MSVVNIKNEIIAQIKKNLPDALSDFELEINIPQEAKMGDLSVACFGLSKISKMPPDKIAADLAGKISAKGGSASGGKSKYVEKVNNIGPYLNFFLKKKIWFKEVLDEVLSKKDKYGEENIGRGAKIVLEFSAPNTNKPQHLGHLRNNFLGTVMANLLSNQGYQVIKANLINDRGIHICKAMLAYQKWGDDKTPDTEKMKPDHFVGQYYVLFSEKVKDNPELLDEAQKMLEKWEAGDSEILSLWQTMNKWAIDGLQQTYKKFKIDFDYLYYESDIYKSGKEIIFKALKSGLCYKRPDGAIEIDLTRDGLDKKVLIRADGTSVYVTQDIGLAKFRYNQFKPAKMLYVVASEQDYHFKVLFRILEIFGFDWVKTCYHFSYGMVFLPEGKMKSREGTVVEADEIINKLEQLAKSEILGRDNTLSPAEVSARAETIALAAIKFYFLKFTPLQDVHFKPEESISFEGATGPYIQYTYARIQSILTKQPSNQATKQLVNFAALGNPEEVEILKSLFVFQNSIKQAVDSYNPAYLANYLLKLSQQFNEFYHKCPVLRAEGKNLVKGRLVLIQAVAQVLKNGLNLLGINVLNKM